MTRKVMTSEAYQIVALIIRKIEDEELRAKVADHFGREFNARSTKFDLAYWYKETGVKMFREKPETEDERRARVLSYVEKVTGRSA